AAGDIRKADKEFAKLKDFRLRGHVLYQRYMHPTAYKSSYEELQNWLALYSDHPGADKIYKLAAKRGGTGNLRKPAPVTGYLKIREQAVYQGEKYKASVTRNDAGKKAV